MRGLACGDDNSGIFSGSTADLVVDGGLEGSPNVADVIPHRGHPEEYAVVTGLTVDDRDPIRVRTGVGGGYGAPRGGDPAAVAADVKIGFITPERAQEVYGSAG